jgi:hypothetical protein
MLACCAFAIVLIAPFIAGWRSARRWLRRVMGLPAEPDNAAVSWQPGTPVSGTPLSTPVAPSPRRVRALVLGAAATVALAGAIAGDVHAPAAAADAYPSLDFICRILE